VDQAQKLGLSGKDVTICVIDTGVDIKHPTFGKDCPDGPACRLAFGYDVESQGTDPVRDAAHSLLCTAASTTGFV
jgi:subtilisin family serine protease